MRRKLGRLQTTGACILGVLASIAIAAHAADPPSFTGIGDVPGPGGIDSRALAVSAGGSIVIGWGNGLGASNHAFVWTPERGIELLGELPGGDTSHVGDVSADGSRIVGSSNSFAAPGSGSEAALWDEALGPIPLGDLPGGSWPAFLSGASGISGDGRTIVGSGKSDSGTEAFRWTETDGMVGLGGLPEGTLTQFLSSAAAISRDGSVIVGSAGSGTGRVAFRWTEAGGMESLGDLPGGRLYAYSGDVSADGSIVVGTGSSSTSIDYEAFVWTQEGGMVGLGFLPDQPSNSSASVVWGNGSIIGGWADRRVPQDGVDENGDPLPSRRVLAAVTWNKQGEIELFEDTLRELGLGDAIDGWLLTSVNDISADGRVFVGAGINPRSFPEGWVAVLPAPTVSVDVDIRPWSVHNVIHPLSRFVIPVAILASDDFDVADVDVTTLAFGPNAAAPAFDPTNPFVYWLSHLDVNQDGKQDLLLRFRTEETGIAMGDTEACLTGETLDGTLIEGCDAIATGFGCGHGFEAALVVPPLVWVGGRIRRRPRYVA